jgi:Protein of unknown function (DUF3592)
MSAQSVWENQDPPRQVRLRWRAVSIFAPGLIAAAANIGFGICYLQALEGNPRNHRWALYQAELYLLLMVLVALPVAVVPGLRAWRRKLRIARWGVSVEAVITRIARDLPGLYRVHYEFSTATGKCHGRSLITRWTLNRAKLQMGQRVTALCDPRRPKRNILAAALDSVAATATWRVPARVQFVIVSCCVLLLPVAVVAGVAYVDMTFTGSRYFGGIVKEACRTLHLDEPIAATIGRVIRTVWP